MDLSQILAAQQKPEDPSFGDYPQLVDQGDRIPAAAFGKKIPKATADQLAQLMGEHQKAIKAQEEQLKKLINPDETDLSPLLALADSWTGSNFSKGYMSPRDKAKLVADTQKNIANEKGSLVRELSSEATRSLAKEPAPTSDWRADRIMQDAANSIHKAPNMKPYVDYMNRLGTDWNTLNQPLVTNTMVNEVMQGMANAISRANVASDYKLRSVEIPTLRGYANDLATLVTSDPDRPAPPKVVEFAKHMVNRLFDNYDTSARKEATRASIGRHFRTPEATRAVKEAVDYYKSGTFSNDLRDSFGLPPRQEVQKTQPTSAASTNTQQPVMAAGPQGPRQIVKKQYNAKLNKTKLIYSDGSEEVTDGQK